MRYPTCRLQNPQTARRCDCGYEFVTLQEGPRAGGLAAVPASGIASAGVLYLGSIDRSLRTIKILMVAWAAFTVLGFIYLVLAGLLRLAAGAGK
jgi:hypothetical protein